MSSHRNRTGSGRRIGAAVLLILVALVSVLGAVPAASLAIANTPNRDLAIDGPDGDAHLAHTIYYVSNSFGNDNYNGTDTATPFKTIAKAAAVAGPGDVVYIRGGTYRENTITLDQSGRAGAPIVFAAFEDEHVIISGAAKVDAWTVFEYNGQRFFSAPASTSDDKLTPEQYQVFVDGKMVQQAREPDIDDAFDPFSQTEWAGAMEKEGSNSLLVDTSQIDSDYLWDPLYVWGRFHNKEGGGDQGGWSTNVAKVGSVSAVQGSNQKRLALTATDTGWWPEQENVRWELGKGVLIGGLSAVDQPNEWHYENGKLYFMPQSSDLLSEQTVEFRQRLWVLKTRDNVKVNYVTLRNLDFFAGQLWLEGDHLVLDNVKISYGSHYTFRSYGGDDKDFRAGLNGALIVGNENSVINSEIAYSAGNGIAMLGNNNLVENCLIHDFGYAGTNSTGVYFKGWNSVLMRSTLFNSGQNLLKLDSCQGCRITRNFFYEAMLLTNDGGSIYAFGRDLAGTEIAYNWFQTVRDRQPGDELPAFSGIYLDNGTRNAYVHHNLGAGLGWDGGVGLNTPHEGHRIYDNTLIHDKAVVGGLPGGLAVDDTYYKIGVWSYCDCNFVNHIPGNDYFRNLDAKNQGYLSWLVSKCGYEAPINECQVLPAVRPVDNPDQNCELDVKLRCANMNYEYWRDNYLDEKRNQHYLNFEEAGRDLVNPVIQVADNGWEILGNPDFRPKSATLNGAYEYGGMNWIPGYRYVPRSPDVTTCPNATPLEKGVVVNGDVHYDSEDDVGSWNSYRFTMPQDGYVVMHADADMGSSTPGAKVGFTLNRLYNPLPIVETRIVGQGVMFANLYAGDYCLTAHPDWSLASPDYMVAEYGVDVSSPLLVSAAAFAFKPGGTIDGIHFYAEDIMAWTRLINGVERWDMIFDGSDVGIRGNVTNIAAEGGSGDRLLLSVARRQYLPGISREVLATDVIVFDPDLGGLGENTSGWFITGLEGYKHELVSAGELIDAIDGWTYGYEADPIYRGCFGYPISTVGTATFTTWGDRWVKQDNEDVFCKVYDEAAGGWRYWDFFFDVAGKRNAPPTEPAPGNVPGLAGQNVNAMAYNDPVDKFYLTVSDRATIWDQRLTWYDIFAINYPDYTWGGILWHGPDHGWDFGIDAIEWNGP